MKTTGTAIKLGIFWLVLLMFTVMIIVVFGQVRFGRTTGYSAVFTEVSGLRAGQFVRAAGVEVGKVKNISINPDATVRVEFTAEKSATLTEGTRAVLRYDNLFGDRYLALEEGAGGLKTLRPGQTIPLSHTEPALDLDALIGGFRPLFRALNPDQVNELSKLFIQAFQDEGPTIGTFLDQAAAVTNTLADRDLLIVLDEAVLDHQEDGLKLIWVFDNRVKANPVSISTFPTPAEADYVHKGGHFGPHNIHENRPGSFVSSQLIFATYQNAGMRVFDIRDPYRPKDVGALVPPAPTRMTDHRPNRAQVIQTADVFVDAGGLIYSTDYNGGLYILEFNG